MFKGQSVTITEILQWKQMSSCYHLHYSVTVFLIFNLIGSLWLVCHVPEKVETRFLRPSWVGKLDALYPWVLQSADAGELSENAK